MRDLHKAALVRAYRTLATGLGGTAISTGLVALISSLAGAGEMTAKAALLALAGSLGAVLVSAVGSFWRAVSQGIPEVDLKIENELLKQMLKDEWLAEVGSADILSQG
jgi:hypothetical protein